MPYSEEGLYYLPGTEQLNNPRVANYADDIFLWFMQKKAFLDFYGDFVICIIIHSGSVDICVSACVCLRNHVMLRNHLICATTSIAQSKGTGLVCLNTPNTNLLYSVMNMAIIAMNRFLPLSKKKKCLCVFKESL